MANTKSAAKRALQSVKRHDRNKAIISAVRTQVRKTREAIKGGDAQLIQVELQKAASVLDKAASKGALHKSNAGRRVARLSAAAFGATKA